MSLSPPLKNILCVLAESAVQSYWNELNDSKVIDTIQEDSINDQSGYFAEPKSRGRLS